MAKELARLEVSPVKRIFAVGLQAGMGLLLLYLVATQPQATLGWRAILTMFGFVLLFFAWRFWLATGAYLFLTADGLFSSSGRHFCTLAEIAKVDRGFFAFRPSGGFLVATKHPVQRGWAPGLWWTFGKSIGVGGATSRPAGKQMADIISVMLTERGAEILEMDND